MKIFLLTSTAYLKPIDVVGDRNSDLLKLINKYHKEQGLPVRLYKEDELTDEELEVFLSINGGECWIEGISHVVFDD